MAVHSVSFCPVLHFLVQFGTFFALKHFCTKIFIRLDVYEVLHSLRCRVNFRLWQRKSLCTFLPAKTDTFLVRACKIERQNWMFGRQHIPGVAALAARKSSNAIFRHVMSINCHENRRQKPFFEDNSFQSPI